MLKVGFREGFIEDHARPAWHGDHARPISWRAWYPTDDEVDEQRRPTGTIASTFVADDSLAGARLSGARNQFPAVLLSHGTGGSAAGLAWLGWRLAAQGFIAVGVNHHGNTAVQPYQPEGFLCWWERARDLSVLLDDLLVRGPFVGRLDLCRVFAAGFSLGGYTVLALLGAITDMALFADWSRDERWGDGPREFPGLVKEVAPLLKASAVFRASWERQSLSYRDDRIKAALLCAPAPTVRGLRVESLRTIGEPVAIIVGGADLEAPSDDCAKWLQNYLPNSTLSDLGSDVGHYVFLSECSDGGQQQEPEICMDAPGVDRRAIHDETAALALKTFAFA